MRNSDFPFIPAWCEMIREMERMGLDIDPFPFRTAARERYIYPFASGNPRPRTPLKNIFRHEIQNLPDEIILVIEAYDCRKESIAIHLLGSDAVEISCIRRNSHEMTFDDHHLRGSWSDTFQHVFPLPEEVTVKDARSTYRNGIIEVRLKKKQGFARKVPIR
jgi:HSP20 family protein